MKRIASEPDVTAKKTKSKELVLRKLWPHQRSAIVWMAQRELPSDRGLPSGGILGDQMGLGKTASILGLIFWNYRKNPSEKHLVIVPSSLLHKWREEWFKHFQVDESSVMIYHGANKAQCVEWDSTLNRWILKPTASLILTTYGQVLADHKAALEVDAGSADPNHYRCGVLSSTIWFRIVLDESHTSIQNDKAKRFAALSQLLSLRRWAVTGTVYTNRWNDIASICNWIGVPPYSDKSWWRECWTRAAPIRIWRFGESSKFTNEALTQGFLRDDLAKPSTLPYILIRTKTLIRNLPVLKVTNLKIDFAPGELDAYGKLAAEFKLAIHRFLASKKRKPRDSETRTNEPARPVENSAHLFRLISKYLVRLRQFCNHPLLAAQGAKWTDCFRHCVDCSSVKGLVLASCGHNLCPDCRDNSDSTSPCSACIQTVPIQLSIAASSDSLHKYGQVGHSTKFEAILHCLDGWRRRVKKDGPLKVVIFSQWVSSFNLLESVLQLNGYRSIRFTGETTNLDDRDKILQTFARDEGIHIMLCGLKVGSVGLDLVMANKAIIMEPWFNLPVEEQAQDRLHRMGQVRPVQVVKLSIQWSVEDWLYDLQSKKAGESKWLIGEWNGQLKHSNAQFTVKELQSLSLYLCPSCYKNHRRPSSSLSI